MGKIIKVREVGDPVLNKISEEVDIKNTNNDILDIIEDLKKLTYNITMSKEKK